MTPLDEYNEKKNLCAKIDRLQAQLYTLQSQLHESQTQVASMKAGLIDIFNLSDAKTEIPDRESMAQSWQRLIESIKAALK